MNLDTLDHVIRLLCDADYDGLAERKKNEKGLQDLDPKNGVTTAH